MSKKILVVEDEMPIAQFVRGVLEHSKYECRFIHNGLEAVDAALNFQPDLILLDVKLPGMDGYQIHSELLQHDETRKIPVIVFTSHGKLEEPFRAASNVAGFIQKPFDVTDLLSKVSTALVIHNK